MELVQVNPQVDKEQRRRMEEMVARARSPTPPRTSEAEAPKTSIRCQHDAALAILCEMGAASSLEEENGHVHDYVSAPTALTQRREVINIVDEQSPLGPGLEAKPWPHKFCPADLLSCADNTDMSEFTHVYEAAVSAAGGHETTMAKSLLL